MYVYTYISQCVFMTGTNCTNDIQNHNTSVFLQICTCFCDISQSMAITTVPGAVPGGATAVTPGV